jgi:hypothetical protein
MSIATLTPSQLRQAADLQETISKLQSELAAIFGSESKAALKPAKPAKKGMSLAGRAKVAAAQKARWAKIKGAKGKTVAEKVIKAVKTAAKPAKKKGRSAASKANQSAKMKAYWAAKKAAKN